MPEAEPSSRPRSRLGSLAVAFGIALSRVFGFVRMAVFGYYFGTSPYADVFTIGQRLPNLLQNLLGEGSLSASFIPVYSELLASGRNKDAGRVAGSVLALLFVLAFALACLGVAFAPLEVAIVAPGFDDERFDLTVTVVRLMFPMTGVLVLSAWALGIQNSHRQFLLSYLSPVVWNLAMIVALIVLGTGLGWTGEKLLIGLAAGALAGAVLQLLIQLPAVRALEPNLLVRWDLKSPEVREIMKNAVPAVLGRGVVQVSGYFDQILGSLLTAGALAAIGYANALYLLPISLFGMSVANAELPELARERSGTDGALRARTRAALDQVAFYVVPSTVVFVWLGDVTLGVFRRGEFDANTVSVVWAALVGYSIGLPASTSSRILSSSFYALRDTRTPARIATVRVLSSTLIGLVAMTQLEPVLFLPGGYLSHLHAGDLMYGSAGLTFGTGIGAWVEWALLRGGLSQRAGGVDWNVRGVGALWAVALVAGAVGFGLHLVMPPVDGIVEAALVFTVFGGVYLGGTAALGLGESAKLLKRVLGAVNRRS